MFFTAMTFFSCNALNVILLKCVSMNNQECKVRPKILNINSNEPLYFPYSVLVNKFSGSCNNINDPSATLCIPDVIKDIIISVFNLISRNNKTHHISWQETFKCKFRLDVSVCNDKQRWNNDKCRCEFKELIDKGKCDDAFI